MKPLCFVMAALCLMLSGCGATDRVLSSQNDELRRANLELERAVDDLTVRLSQREQELATAHGQAGVPGPDGVHPPRLAGIEFGRLTGVLPRESSGGPAELRVYLRPIDQDGRLMTAAGEARVRLVHTPAQGSPVVLLDERHGPEVWHAAYRDGMTGTHYTLKATLPETEAPTALLHVSLTDAATGRVWTAERVVGLR